MQSQRNRCGFRRADKVRSRGCSPGSFSAQRPDRSIIKGLIAEVALRG